MWCSRREHRREAHPRDRCARLSSCFSVAPNAYAPATQVSASAWQSSTASLKPTTEPSPSPPGLLGALRHGAADRRATAHWQMRIRGIAARQRCSVDSMSLKAIEIPAAREPVSDCRLSRCNRQQDYSPIFWAARHLFVRGVSRNMLHGLGVGHAQDVDEYVVSYASGSSVHWCHIVASSHGYRRSKARHQHRWERDDARVIRCLIPHANYDSTAPFAMELLGHKISVTFAKCVQRLGNCRCRWRAL